MIANASSHIRIAMCLAFMVSSAPARGRAEEPESVSATSPEAPEEDLRSKLESFSLSLVYNGEYDFRYPRLLLTAATRKHGAAFEINFLPVQIVRISHEQAHRIIDHLDRSMLLKQLSRSQDDRYAPPPNEVPGRSYVLLLTSTRRGGRCVYRADLGWGRSIVDFIVRLKSVLEGDAATKLGRLEEELRDHMKREAVARTTEPVEVGGLEFAAVGETGWTAPDIGMENAVELSLRITNRSNQILRFNRYDTVRIELKDHLGRSIPLGGGRNGTLILPPLVLRPGETQVMPRRGTLQRDQTRKTVSFAGRDGTGVHWSFAGLEPGRYSLAFTCRNDWKDTIEMEERLSFRNHGSGKVNVAEGLTYWRGKVTTNALDVRLTEAEVALLKP